MFLGSIEARNRAAILLTIISTAVRNDLDVWAYVKDVLDQLLGGPTGYHSLRADVRKQSHPESICTYRVDERRDAADRRHYRRAQRRLAGRSPAGLSPAGKNSASLAASAGPAAVVNLSLVNGYALPEGHEVHTLPRSIPAR